MHTQEKKVNKFGHVYLHHDKLKKRAAIAKPFITPVTTEAPLEASVKQYCPSPYNQGNLGSCTANAFCAAYQLLATKNNTHDAGFEPSRLFFYYNERIAEDPLHKQLDIVDTGADVADGEQYCNNYGVCSEQSWAYDLTKCNSTPTKECYDEALKHKISGFNVIPVDKNVTTNIENTIAAGSSILCAVGIYNSFESDTVAKTGVVPVPKPKNYDDPNDTVDACLGGHEMLVVGYNRTTQLFTVLNSWGSNWGDHGFCYIPYGYFANPNLSHEFSVIRL